MKKLYCVNSGKYRKFEKPKTSYLVAIILVFLLFSVSVRMKIKKIIWRSRINWDIKNGCISISVFASLLGIPITSYAIGLKIYVKAAGTKKYKSIIKKKTMMK